MEWPSETGPRPGARGFYGKGVLTTDYPDFTDQEDDHMRHRRPIKIQTAPREETQEAEHSDSHLCFLSALLWQDCILMNYLRLMCLPSVGLAEVVPYLVPISAIREIRG